MMNAGQRVSSMAGSISEAIIYEVKKNGDERIVRNLVCSLVDCGMLIRGDEEINKTIRKCLKKGLKLAVKSGNDKLVKWFMIYHAGGVKKAIYRAIDDENEHMLEVLINNSSSPGELGRKALDYAIKTDNSVMVSALSMAQRSLEDSLKDKDEENPWFKDEDIDE